jgi:hypothetical protein
VKSDLKKWYIVGCSFNKKAVLLSLLHIGFCNMVVPYLFNGCMLFFAVILWLLWCIMYKVSHLFLDNLKICFGLIIMVHQ